jgi:hypothetical protein
LGAFLIIFYTVGMKSDFDEILHNVQVDFIATNSIEVFNVSSSASELKGLIFELNEFPKVDVHAYIFRICFDPSVAGRVKAFQLADPNHII